MYEYIQQQLLPVCYNVDSTYQYHICCLLRRHARRTPKLFFQARMLTARVYGILTAMMSKANHGNVLAVPCRFCLCPFSRPSFASPPPPPPPALCQDRVACQSLPTIKECMRAVEALKPRGYAALEDVTRLEGHPDGHPDLKEGRLQYKRVTRKSLLHPEFINLTGIEQEAYVYRLAR